MKILFLGGTGNLSAECAEELCRRGHEVLVLTRGRNPVPPRYRALRADRKNPASMRAALQGSHPEAVLNFIGYDLPEVRADVDLFGGQVRQYLFISSTSVYAKPPVRLPFTEESPVGNVWWEYARKKQACEEWLRKVHQGSGFPITIVRPSHTYSKRWIPNPVSSASYTFAARLEQGKPVLVPDDGQNPWTLTAASDFAVGLAGLVGNDSALGETVQITSGEALTWNQIVAEIAAALGAQSPQVLKIPTDFICEIAPQLTGTLKGDKAHPGLFDNSKIKRLVPEFECRKPFSVGVRESVTWLHAHPEHQNLNPQVDDIIDAVVAAWGRK